MIFVGENNKPGLFLLRYLYADSFIDHNNHT